MAVDHAPSPLVGDNVLLTVDLLEQSSQRRRLGLRVESPVERMRFQRFRVRPPRERQSWTSKISVCRFGALAFWVPPTNVCTILG